jgi:hypothetical protein
LADPSSLLLPTGSPQNRSWVYCTAYRSTHPLTSVQEWDPPNNDNNDNSSSNANIDPALRQVLDKIEAAANNPDTAIPLHDMLPHATRKMNFSV